MTFVWILLALIIGLVAGYFFTHSRYKAQVGSLEELMEKQATWENKLKQTQDELWQANKNLDDVRAESNRSLAIYQETKAKADRQTQELNNALRAEIDKTNRQIQELNNALTTKQTELDKLSWRTTDLQKMEQQRHQIEQAFAELSPKRAEIAELNIRLTDLKSELSLYSENEEFVSYGIYPLPKYGEVSSGAYLEKLKDIRQAQKQLIKDETAYTSAIDTEITGNTSHDKKLIKNQGKLLITAFNSECDYLISKVNSSNFEATITKIEKLAEQLEKHLLSLEIGISLDYVELKMQECATYYQYIHQKQAEAEEQREIRAQIREEAAAQREIERAIREAEKEEQMLQRAMEQARRELESASSEQKQFYEAKLAELGQRLAEAESKEQRAISMAQQTKRGHVYVISNIGSFGEDIYKIGMTRRLDPLDRVIELGDASVPFAFDVHAMIFSENAPALEKQLHDYFADVAVNKINRRKEFFDIPLAEIRKYLEEQGIEARWTMTAEATEYRQSLAISEEMINAA